MAELATLSGDFYGALWKSPLEDIFFHHFPFRNEKVQYGPYFSRQEYNTGLVAALANSRPDQTLSASDQALAEKLLRLDDERRVFSHGDLHLNNIIIDDSCRITGIVDWEGAGFSIPGRDYYEAKTRARKKEWTEALSCVFPKEAQVHYELLRELERAGRSADGFAFGGQAAAGADRTSRAEGLRQARAFVGAGADHVVLGIPASAGPSALRSLASEVAEPLRDGLIIIGKPI